jgi:protein tyrosine phosphatase
MKPTSIATNLSGTTHSKETTDENTVEAVTQNMKKLNSHLEYSTDFSLLCQNTQIPWLKRFKNLNSGQILSILSQEFDLIDKNSPVHSSNGAALQYDKNRYKDVLPWDYNLVSLKESLNSGIELYFGQNYINASYIQPEFSKSIQEFDKKCSNIIATQGPLPRTIQDFWTLVYNQDVTFIYNLTCEEEGGRSKCARYWITSFEQVLEFSGLFVKLQNLKQQRSWTEYTFSLIYQSVEKTVTMYHFQDWPDHSSSDSKKVLDLVQTCIPHYLSKTRLLVHCSAGVGRTGTFLTCLHILSQLSLDKSLNRPSETGGDSADEGGSLVQKIVERLRSQRIFSVQSLEQYIFIYQVILSKVNESNKL